MHLLAFLTSALSLGSVKDCSQGQSLFKITSMSFSPDPPVRGENSTLLLSIDVPTQVDAGTATYSYTYNSIPLTPDIKNLCLELPSGCPIMPGQLQTVSSFPIDSTTPTGTIVAKIQWSDTMKTNLMCVAVTIKI